MDYEEKLKTIINSNKTPFVDIDTFLKYFPELKESDDEKIRKVLIELVKCNERSGYFMFNNITTSSMLAWLEKQGEQKPAWSEEDEVMLKEALRMIERPGSIFKGEILTKKVADWLKSLKGRVQPQNRWKPSDEQIECLSDAIKHYNSLGYPAPKLKELLDGLNKLMK